MAAADPPTPTPPGVLSDQAGPVEFIPAGRILADGLRVLDRLGSTPDGQLYNAEYSNGVEVTLAILHPEPVGGGSSTREWFGRATQIQHPNVAAVYDVNQMEDGSAYVVLERLVGEPLSNYLTEGRVFALREALDLVLQAAAGLQAAHRAGFVHGNLSPETILVTPVAYERFQVKLTGFTLDPALRQRRAKPPSAEEASAGYASPERLDGYPLDERSDVFSLGAVLHHLLTGAPPDRGNVETSVPRVARAVLDTALKPAPAQRFQTVSELDQALRRLASLAAKPKRAAIYRALLLGAVGVGLALVTGGMWLLSGSRWRAVSEERPAQVVGTKDLGGTKTGFRRSNTPTTAPIARSPVRPPSVARQDALRTRNSHPDSHGSQAGASARPEAHSAGSQSSPTALADAETDRSIATGKVGTPPPGDPSLVPTPPTPTERFVGMEQPIQGIEGKRSADLSLPPQRKGRKTDGLILGDQTMRAPGGSPRTDSAPSRSVRKQEIRQTGESLETPQALGYVGEPPASSVPNSPGATLAREAWQLRATPPTLEAPRSRAELELDQGFHQSLKDIMRLGIAEDVAEIRPGLLRVSLTQVAIHVPNAMYRLQRLYLAYGAATAFRDEVALELRHGTALYGWFTGEGLTRVSSE